MNSPKTCQPRRSVLYVPGDKPRAIAKAATLPVDAVILDLEDAVLPAAKEAARAAIAGALGDGAFGHREVVVRINGADTPWAEADLRMAAHSGADAILLPKVNGAGELRQCMALLDRQRAPRSLKVWVMAETARGVLAIDSIAAVGDRLQAIVMGTADLGRELRVREEPGRPGLLAALLPALGRCLLAARAHHLDILDGVYPDLADMAGFRAACLQGRSLGFDGKTLIHPGQIEAANEFFGVSADEAARAAELVAGFEAAAAEGRGIAVVGGRMVERLHADEARRIMQLHAAILRRDA